MQQYWPYTINFGISRNRNPSGPTYRYNLYVSICSLRLPFITFTSFIRGQENFIHHMHQSNFIFGSPTSFFLWVLILIQTLSLKDYIDSFSTFPNLSSRGITLILKNFHLELSYREFDEDQEFRRNLKTFRKLLFPMTYVK